MRYGTPARQSEHSAALTYALPDIRQGRTQRTILPERARAGVLTLTRALFAGILMERAPNRLSVFVPRAAAQARTAGKKYPTAADASRQTQQT